MDFKRLRTFRSAARTLSFSESAQELGYVQSAVTSQIKSLEEELDQRLFDRNARGVTLTPAGERLLTYANKLFALRSEALASLPNCTALSGTLDIAGYETIITYRLPSILNQFMREYPKVRVSIHPLPVKVLKKHLIDSDIDVAFILEEPFDIPGIACREIRKERVVVIAAPDHPLAQKSAVTADDLVGETLLLTEPGCHYRNLFERALIRAGAYDGPRLEFSSIEAIKSCVKLGTGVAAISEVSVQCELAKGSLVELPWTDTSLSVSLNVAWSQHKQPTPALQTFLDMCLTGLEAEEMEPV